MGTDSGAGYAEEVSMHHAAAAKYLEAARDAAQRLGWLIAGSNESSVICHTQPHDNSYGEEVTITAMRKTAVVNSRPLDIYYWTNDRQRMNVAAFIKTVRHSLDALELADRNLHPMHREKYGALVPSKSYLVTPIIVYINALVFIAMVLAGLSPLHPTAQSLFLWGGNFRLSVLDGEWWRLITYMFLHGGAVHLLMNTFALLYIGMFLEPLLGKLRFAAAYILTGICAGLLSIVVHSNSVGVGASGAIFGMYGIFLSVLTTSHIQKSMRRTMLRSILFFVLYNLLAGLQGNTDNAAHIGGLISGFIMGYVYYPGMSVKASTVRQLFTTCLLSVAVGTLVSAVMLLLHMR